LPNAALSSKSPRLDDLASQDAEIVPLEIGAHHRLLLPMRGVQGQPLPAISTAPAITRISFMHASCRIRWDGGAKSARPR